MYERRRLMFVGKKKLYIYKSGYTEIKNCSEYGTFEEESKDDPAEFSITTDYLSYFQQSGFGGTVAKVLFMKTDFTKYKKIVVELEANGKSYVTYSAEAYLFYVPYLQKAGTSMFNSGFNISIYGISELENAGIEYEHVEKGNGTLPRTTMEYDISNLTGENYIVIAGGVSNTMKIYDIHLET